MRLPTRTQICAIILMVVWAVAVAVVNPSGEFMVNDDWSFVKILEGLNQGTMIATGWGLGGPSAIVHVLWGKLFTSIIGFSLTSLRVSVLFMAIVGSVVLLLLLRATGVPAWSALIGTLIVVLNPLFLAESFTFMTDVTFAALVIFSVTFLHHGVEKSRTLFLILGLVFALLAILTRQLGVVIPMAYLAASLSHPEVRKQGLVKPVSLVLLLTMLPWFIYEAFLFEVGSTPVAQHEAFRNILRVPSELGFVSYLVYLFSLLVQIGLGYVAFFLFPLLALRWPDYLRRRDLRLLYSVLTAAFVMLEAAILSSIVAPTVWFHGNVIFNLGIGPIVLKDTYLLGVQRTVSLPISLYYLFVFCAIAAAVPLVGFAASSLKHFLRPRPLAEPDQPPFVAYLTLYAAIFYMGIITLTWYEDRYLIPVIIFLVVWLLTTHLASRETVLDAKRIVAAAVPLCLLGAASVMAVHDFNEMKRSLTKAHQYLLADLKVNPCNVDGGFEFNGYHCYRKDFTAQADLSWWWVSREDYLVTLGPLPGYRIVRTFPFARYIGPDMAVHVLQPEEGAERPAQ